MSTKTYEKLVHVNYTAGDPVTPQMIVADFKEYLLPLGKLVNKALHGWGVASGLEVTVTADGAGVQVASGVAVDRHGQLLVLATGGHAQLGTLPPLAETPVPVVLPTTDALKGKTVVVTMQLKELPPSSATPQIPGGKIEQAPWVNLVLAQDFADSDNVVVLATFDVDIDGKVTGIVSGTTPARQRLGITVGQLSIERSGPFGASETVMGTIGPLAIGTGLQVSADVTALTGKVCIAPISATPPADPPGTLVVLSSTPGGGGGVETRDANGNRMAAFTTTGLGANQAGYFSVGTAAGTEAASISVSATGAGQVNVQTRAGKPAVLLDTVGAAGDGAVHVFSNNVEVTTIGPGGISSRGNISTQGDITAQGRFTAYGSVTTASLVSQGDISTNGELSAKAWIKTDQVVSAVGGVIAKAGIWTDGNVQTKGTVFADGNAQIKGTVFADRNVQTKGTVFVAGNVQCSGGGVVAKAGIWTDGNVQPGGSLIATGWAIGKAGLATDGNVRNGGQVISKGAIFTDGDVVAKGNIFGKSKNFVMTHPNDELKDIVYGCIEGPEAAAYIRGRASLIDGRAKIELPEHFVIVVNSDTLTIQLTPRSATSKGLAAAESGANGITVQELFDGTGSYDFDYFVAGVRNGYENYQPVVSKGTSPTETPHFGKAEAGVTSVALASVPTPQSVPVPAPTAAPIAQPVPSIVPTAGPDGKPGPWNLL